MEKAKTLDLVYAAIRQVQVFLEPYLLLANTHGAEFLSENHWHKYVSPSTQASLLQLSAEDLVNLPLLTSQGDSKDKNVRLFEKTSERNGESAVGPMPIDGAIKDLASFISQAQSCHLGQLNVLTPVEAVLPHIPTKNPLVVSEAMPVKKLHEVGIMVDAVSALYKSTQSDLVVDIGSGKGYFASELSRKENIPVVGFDSRDTNTHGASQRDKKLAKKWAGLERRIRKKQSICLPAVENKLPALNVADEQNDERNDDSRLPILSQNNFMKPPACTNNSCLQDSTKKTDSNSSPLGAVSSAVSSRNETSAALRKKILSPKGDIQHCDKSAEKTHELYAPVTLYMHPEMDLYEVIHQNAPHLLQGCGDSDSLKLFLSVVETHDLQNEKEIHFPLSSYGKRLKLHLGRNARNLASQSVHRIQASGQLQGGDFLWRALLNVLLADLCIPVPERIIGLRGLNKKCNTFQDYVRMAFEKEGISEQLPEPRVLEDLETRHKEAPARMSAFFQLKLVLAPVIEALILLDRLAFLLEQDEVSSAHLIQLFDPVMSPRCFALIAMKQRENK